jgi:hypothetical protein
MLLHTVTQRPSSILIRIITVPTHGDIAGKDAVDLELTL